MEFAGFDRPKAGFSTLCHALTVQSSADLIVVSGVGSQARQLGDVDDRAGVVCIECCSINNQVVTPNTKILNHTLFLGYLK